MGLTELFELNLMCWLHLLWQSVCGVWDSYLPALLHRWLQVLVGGWDSHLPALLQRRLQGFVLGGWDSYLPALKHRRLQVLRRAGGTLIYMHFCTDGCRFCIGWVGLLAACTPTGIGNVAGFVLGGWDSYLPALLQRRVKFCVRWVGLLPACTPTEKSEVLR